MYRYQHRYVSHCCRFALSNKPIGALLLDTRITWRVRMLEHSILMKVAQKGMHSTRGRVRVIGADELRPNEVVKWYDPKFNLEP